MPPEYTPGKEAPFAGISNTYPLRELENILVDRRVLFLRRYRLNCRSTWEDFALISVPGRLWDGKWQLPTGSTSGQLSWPKVFTDGLWCSGH